MESDSILAGSSPEFVRNDIDSQLCSASVCCDTFMEQGPYLAENGYETPSSPPCLLPHPSLDQNCCSPSSCTPPVLHQQPSPPSSEDSIGCISPPEGIVSQSTGGSVARRNERERKRVRMVNMGFAKLRQYVPTAARGKRLSKVETLRSAIDYIRQLKQLLLYHQHYVEDNGAEYYRHLYEPQPKMGAMPFQFSVPRHRNFFYDGGLPAAYAAESSGPAGCAATWSVGNDSACFESDMPPGCGAIMDGESQMACWAI